MQYAVLAGGNGTRLGAPAVSKAMTEVAGRPLVRRLIDLFVANNATVIYIAINPAAADVAAYLRQIATEVPVKLEVLAIATSSPLESFVHILGRCDRNRPLVATTVDTVFEAEAFARYIDDFTSAQAHNDALMAITESTGDDDDQSPLYVSVDREFGVKGFSDTSVPSTNGHIYLSAGVYGLTPMCFPVVDQALAQGGRRLRDFQRELLEACLKVEAYDLGPVVDLDTPSDLVEARVRAISADVQSTMQSILRAEADAVASIPVSEAYARAVSLIIDRVHRRGGKLVTSGMGKAGQIAMNIATTFSSTGTPAVNLHPAEAQHGDLGLLRPDDVLLLISNSGKTSEIVKLIELAHGLYADLPVIVITGNDASPLAAMADVLLYTGGAPEVCPLGLTPTTSTTVMTVIGDVLVVNVMKLIGFTRADYARRHHGGYLGQIASGK